MFTGFHPPSLANSIQWHCQRPPSPCLTRASGARDLHTSRRGEKRWANEVHQDMGNHWLSMVYTLW